LLAQAGGTLAVAFGDLLDLCSLRFRQIKRAEHVTEAAAMSVHSAASPAETATTLREADDDSRNQH
jgi:hypothetical protein